MSRDSDYSDDSDEEEKQKWLFKIGKIGFGICMMLMGLAAMTDFFQRYEDLTDYYLFWQMFSNARHDRPPSQYQLDEFARNSLFEFYRYMNAILYITAGALILSNKIYGALFGIVAIFINSVFHANPLIFGDPIKQQQSWIILLKQFAVVGGALFLMTRGKLRSED